jgi:hypothetical protein
MRVVVDGDGDIAGWFATNEKPDDRPLQSYRAGRR